MIIILFLNLDIFILDYIIVVGVYGYIYMIKISFYIVGMFIYYLILNIVVIGIYIIKFLIDSDIYKVNYSGFIILEGYVEN